MTRFARRLVVGSACVLGTALLGGCGGRIEQDTSIGETSEALTGSMDVWILFVHGLQSCQGSRQNADHALVDLEASVNAASASRISSYQTAHPGLTIATHTARANVYTAPASGIHPSNSTDPLLMDDWKVGDPGCTTTLQGQPCTTAYEWRYRLAEEIKSKVPSTAKNIVIVGHSAGARAAMEVAANVGPNGVGTYDWGVQSRIAGVVTIQGMIDNIGTSKYNVQGPASFETECKNGDIITGWGDSCAPGNGFCEWAARTSGYPAADWVATNKRARMLTSWASCSPSAFNDDTDGVLPYDAQASTWAVGLDMTPTAGKTYRHADGEKYGSFCHSDITNASASTHAQAVSAATTRILDFLFTAAPRVANQGSNTTSTSIAYKHSSATFTMGTACPSGDVDDTATQGDKGAGLDVVGVCKHPGYFDGDDHPVAMSELTVSNGATCNGSFYWTQQHDSNNNHAATFWWKTRSERAAGAALVASMAVN